MNIDKQKISFNQIITRQNVLFSVEDNIIIPDVNPDILSVVNSSSNLYVYKKELTNGKVKFDGGVQLDIAYIADDDSNNIRALHTALDFSKNIDIDNLGEDDYSFSYNLFVKSIEPKILNGRKISAKANIEGEIILYLNREKELVSAINDVDQIQKISETLKVNSLKGAGETVCSAKDTVEISDNLADILGTDIYVRNKEIKVSYNKVLSKANCVVDIMYLTEGEQVKNITAQIPIMGFIDIPGVLDDDVCTVNYEIRNINIKQNSVEERSATIDIEFFISCQVYENKEISLIRDLYSPDEELKLDLENVTLMQNRNCISDTFNLNDKINIPEIKDNNVYSLKICPNITNQNILNGELIIQGNAEVCVIYESNITGKLDQKTQTIDFSHTVKSECIGKNTELSTIISTESKDFHVSDAGNVDFSAQLDITIDMYNKMPVDIISNIKVEKIPENAQQNSLVIYFVKEGDTIWKIAKKFRSTIDEIAQVNESENVDKLSVGTQLFIPRHVNIKTY